MLTSTCFTARQAFAGRCCPARRHFQSRWLWAAQPLSANSYRPLLPPDWPMLARKPIFPNVIEMNFQAGEVLGCCVYLVFNGSDWLLIDIGLDDTVEEIVELIRQIDFPLSKCKMLIATHAD